MLHILVLRVFIYSLNIKRCRSIVINNVAIVSEFQ
jgi:hypothetical protein